MKTPYGSVVRLITPHSLNADETSDVGSLASGCAEWSNYYPDVGTASIGCRGQDYPPQDNVADHQKFFHQVLIARIIKHTGSSGAYSLLPH
jgi:hypothetical protein